MAKCPHCKTENAGDAVYCHSCGQPLETAAIPALAAPATTPKQSSAPDFVVLEHLAILLVILLGFSYMGAGGRDQGTVQRFGRPTFYLATIIWEWVLLAYVWVGMRRQRLTLAEVTGGKWKTVEDALLDVAVAAGFWIVAAGVLVAVGLMLGIAHGPSQGPQQADALKEAMKKIAFLAPANLKEVIIWVGLSATAGFCEEIIFRGYLQRQFIALTGSSLIGILLSAAIFGASHGYQGAPRMVQIGVFGLMFGVLAHFRKSLRPGMMAHAWHDSISGIALYAIQRAMKP